MQKDEADLNIVTHQNINKNGKPVHRGWILAALMMTMMLAAMDNTIVSTAIPQIVGDLGGFSLFSWVFSIYLLIQTVTIPLYGKLADMYGRKPILIAGTIVFLIGSATCALSWNMYSIFPADKPPITLSSTTYQFCKLASFVKSNLVSAFIIK